MRSAPTNREDRRRTGPVAPFIEVRPARLRDAWGVGLRAARVLEAEARGHRRSDGRRRRRLHQVRATYPPRPFRLYALVLVNVLTVAALPSWIGRTDDDWAVVTTWPLSGPERHRYRLREIAVVAAIELLVLGGVVGLVFIRPELLVVPALAMCPMGWVIVREVTETQRARELRQCRRALVAEAVGPVHFAAGLASGGGGAGACLVRELAERADREGVTLVGRAEAGPLVALYERAGFRVAASAPTRWGSLVLVVREPRPGSADGQDQPG